MMAGGLVVTIAGEPIRRHRLKLAHKGTVPLERKLNSK
jgi:hypothetical protein